MCRVVQVDTKGKTMSKDINVFNSAAYLLIEHSRLWVNSLYNITVMGDMVEGQSWD